MAPPEVTIEQGKLRGSTGTNLRGETFLKFQGIPYAKPPLSELRFKSPQPPKKWSGVFDASKEGENCYSCDMYRPELVLGSENCLVLNVYTKKISDEKGKNLCPVLFWIHGGGFIYGSGSEDLYSPDYLITEDVVVVTINYRLGILGEFVFIFEIQNKNNLS
jgi:carboxylesterase type B